MSRGDWRLILREASQLRGAGRVEEAIAAYKRLLALKPDLPASWYNLGWLQKQARQFSESLESYGRALELNVAEPEEVHVNRAVIYSDHLGKPMEAERELRTALEKNPSYVPALLNLGNLHEDFGERAQALAAYEKVLSIEPQHNLGLARLAGVSHSADLNERLAERLLEAIARPTVTGSEKANLGFALAGLLDAAGRYDEAFDAASAANAASRTATGAHYDRAAHEQFVDRLIFTFDGTLPAAEPAGAAPVFICGMFRSGSTLVEQILASHSRVTSAGELDLIPALVSRIPNYPETIAKADISTLADWRDFYLRGLPVRPSADCVVTDKRPDNFLHIGFIKALFPAAKIVHTRRNPFDNILSLYFLHLDPNMAYALDLEGAAHWYREYLRLMAHWKALYPHDILDVDYDELVRNPRPVAASLLSFCGLNWEDEVLDFHRSRSAVKTASVWQVREPLHARSSGRWSNYQEHLRGLESILSTGTGSGFRASDA